MLGLKTSEQTKGVSRVVHDLMSSMGCLRIPKMFPAELILTSWNPHYLSNMAAVFMLLDSCGSVHQL